MFVVVFASATALTVYTMTRSKCLSDFLDALSEAHLSVWTKFKAFAAVWVRPREPRARGRRDPTGPRRAPHYRYTSTGIVVCVRTFCVSLPSSMACIPRRPCEAIMIKSQPRATAVSMMAW